MDTSVRAASGPATLVVALLMAMLSTIWGSTWLAIKFGLQDVPPLTGAAMRFTLAAAGMALVARRWAAREGGGRAPWECVLAHGMGQFTLNYGIVYTAEQVLPSGLAAVLWSVFPLFVMLGERFVFRTQSLSVRAALGMLTAFGGIVTLFFTDLLGFEAKAVPMGLLMLLAPLSVAIGTLYIKHRASHFSSLLLNRDGMAVGAASLWVASLVWEQPARVLWTRTALLSIGYLAIVGSTVTFAVYMWLLRFVPATRMSLISFISPVLALFLGAALGGEPLGPRTLIGTGLVLGGVIGVVRSS